MEKKTKLEEKHFEELGFTKHLVIGTGWLTTNSMRDAVYYYTNRNLRVTCSEFWRWYKNDELRQDIAVYFKEDLLDLLKRI